MEQQVAGQGCLHVKVTLRQHRARLCGRRGFAVTELALGSSLQERAGQGLPVLKWVPSAGHQASYASAKRASRTRCAVRDACTQTGVSPSESVHKQIGNGECRDKRQGHGHTLASALCCASCASRQASSSSNASHSLITNHDGW